MTTITINISADSVVEDFAKASGYRATDLLTGTPNPQTEAEFAKSALTNLIVSRVLAKRRSPDTAETAVKTAIEAEIS